MADETKPRKKGFFSRIFGGKGEEVETVVETPVVVGEPLPIKGVPDVFLPEEPPVEEPIPSEAEIAEKEIEAEEREEEIENAATVETNATAIEQPAEPAVANAVEVEAAPEVIMPEELEAEEHAAEIREAEEAPSQAPPTPEEKLGFFARLKQRLSKTKTGLVERVKQVILLHSAIDEDLIEEIEMILVQADVGIETTGKILDQLRKKKEARGITNPQDLIPIIKESILQIVSHDERTLNLQPKRPTVMLVIGVNGVGKTTTIGKIARQYRDQKKSVVMVAGDTFRAAAIEQLAIWADRTGSRIVKSEMGGDPAALCYEALSQPEVRSSDVVLIDTAGRLHTKSNLMEELKKIDRVIKKVIPDAPHETLLILDATTGQNALSQAKIFSEAVGITGFLMTKLDGTAKGGILIALRDLFDIPVLKIGIGEGVEDLRDFNPDDYVNALFENGGEG